jgi:hypothetical protein
MHLFDGVFEFDSLSPDLEQHAGFLLMQGFPQLVFEGGHLRQQLTDSVVHRLFGICMQAHSPPAAFRLLDILPHRVSIAAIAPGIRTVCRRATGHAYLELS